jgi:transcriptional regulator with XRE-family HTH domain
MTDVKFISARLAEKMKEKELNDATLAKQAGISKTTIYYLRKGRDNRGVTTSAEYLLKIAKALNTAPEYFVDADADASPNQKKMSALVADIASIAEELSPSKQRELRELSTALAKIDRTTKPDDLYVEIMELLTRLTEVKGGQKILKELVDYMNLLAAGSASLSVPRRTKRRNESGSTESTDEPT